MVILNGYGLGAILMNDIREQNFIINIKLRINRFNSIRFGAEFENHL